MFHVLLVSLSCEYPYLLLDYIICKVIRNRASACIFPKQFTVGVLNAVLSVSALAGVLCPPRRACLLSPNLSPTWLCLSPWLGCCVRLAGLVSQFVSHLALSFTLAGVLCPPRWACLRSCLPICLPPGFNFHLGWGAICLPICLLGCCVRLAGLVSQFVSQFVSHLALSFTLAGVLCPPRWACLPIWALSFTLAGVLYYLPTYLLLRLLLLLLLNVFSAFSCNFSVVFDFYFVSSDFWKFLPWLFWTAALNGGPWGTTGENGRWGQHYAKGMNTMEEAKASLCLALTLAARRRIASLSARRPSARALTSPASRPH